MVDCVYVGMQCGRTRNLPNTSTVCVYIVDKNADRDQNCSFDLIYISTLVDHVILAYLPKSFIPDNKIK